MGVRALQDDEDFTPLEQPKPAPARRGTVRALSDADSFVPLHVQIPPSEPDSFARVLGEETLETAKDVPLGLARGAVKLGDFFMTLGKYAFPSGADEETMRAADQIQEEQRKSAMEFWTPKAPTPAGEVGGGLAEMGPALALTGGASVVPLVGSEALNAYRDAKAQGLDEATAQKLAGVSGVVTAAGAKLPIVGKTLGARLTTGAIGNVALGEAGREKRGEILTEGGHPELAQPFDAKQTAIDALMGLVFGGLHHANAEQPNVARARVEPDQGIEGELVPPGPRPRPPAGPGVTVEGATIKPAYPELPPPPPKQIPPEIAPHELNPLEQEFELEHQGLTPDVIANLIRLEDRAEAERAGRVLPPPDTTLQVSPEGVARPAVDVEAEARAEARARDQAALVASNAAKAEAARKAGLGLTPDVEANLARLEAAPKPIGDVVAQAAAAGRELTTAPSQEGAGQPTAAAAPRIRPLEQGEEVTPVSRPAVDHGILSPSGKVSKRAEAAAKERNRVAIFGPEGLKKPAVPQPTEAVALRRQAKELRDLAARGQGPKKNLAKAAELEARAERLETSAAAAKQGGEIAKSQRATDERMRGERQWQQLMTGKHEAATSDMTPAEATKHLARLDAAPGDNPSARAALERVAQQGKTAKTAKPKSVLEHLADHGGLSIDALEKEGIDRKDMQSVRGFKRPFTKKGMSLDAAAESLAEAGYPVRDEAGRPDANKALDLIDRELKGQRTHPQGAVEQAPAEVERRRGEQREPARSQAPASGERRGEIGERRKTHELTPEEMHAALTISDKTGLPNRRAYEDAELDKKPHQASIDVDSFKWFNDTFSHDDGDKILEALGRAFSDTGHDVYHMSGDEFALAGDTAEEIHTKMEDLREAAARLQFTFENPEGERWTVDGLGLSYGVGKDLKSADAELQRDKAERTARGERPARGEQPTGAAREGSAVQEGNAPYRRAGPPEEDVDERTAEHVTLKGEGFLSHKGPVEHVDLEGDAGDETGGEVREPGNYQDDLAELEAAYRAAHEKGTDEDYARARRATVRFEKYHGSDNLRRATERIDKELGIDEASNHPPKPRPKPKQGDLFTKEDARPGSNARQIANANKLLAELHDAAHSDVEQDIKSLAVAFDHEFHTDHTASLVGKTIAGTKDLATLSEIFRNPRFETLRYFVTNKDGRIIAQTGVSSRLPASGAAYPTGQSMSWIKNFFEGAKGDGRVFWMQHNHPSGYARPSNADTALTISVAKQLGVEVRHVIVDHDHYGRIVALPDGTLASNETIPLREKEGTPDKIHTPSKPHAMLGRSIMGPKTFVEVAKELGGKSGYVTVIGSTGSSMKVRTIGDMPAHLFNNPERLKQQLRRYGVQNGNSRLFIAGLDPAHFRSSESRKLLNSLIDDGYVLDVVSSEGHSYIESGGGNQVGGGIVSVSGRELGTTSHEVATEVKPREPGAEREPTPRRAEQQQDLLGDNVEQKNKLAKAEREKTAKRSPNKEVSADTGKPGDLFTLGKQLEIREPLHPPDDVAFEKDESHEGDQIVIRGVHNDVDVGRLEIERTDDGDYRVISADVFPEHQGRGIGQELIRRAYQAAKDHGGALMSDSNVSFKQLRAYEALRRQGWTIKYSRPKLVEEVLSGTKYDAQGVAVYRPKSGVYNDNGTPVVKKIEPPADEVGESRGRYGNERRGGEEGRQRRLERGGRREGDEDKSQKGDKGYAAVAQKAIDAWNKKIGWRYGPLGRLPEKKAYLEERYRALGKVTESQELARNVYESLKDATPEDAKAIYEYMTNRNGDATAIADQEKRRAAIRAKKLIDDIGQKLVSSGLLSKEAYDEHAGEYLPRMYLKHVLGEGALGAIGSGKRMSDLGYLKQRKDIPEDIRKVILGEITDPAFLASFGVSRTMRDLALVDFLHAIAGREVWTPKHSTVEWRGRQVTPFYLADEARDLRKRAQLYKDPAAKAAALKMADEAQRVADEGLEKLHARPDPNDFEQIPNSKRYGALRGMYVRKEIYGDLVGAQQWIPPNSSVAEALLGQGGVMAKAQSWWKMSKVILNPPTQVRNFVANMSLLHLSGVPFHRVYSGEIIGKAINSIANKDRFYQIAKKYGLFSATFANNEGARIRDEWLALQDMKGGGIAKMKAFAGRAVNAASDFYQLMEAIGKIAKIRDAIEREGKSPADAVLEAHEALFDYSLVPRSVQYLRNAPIGAPFITFAYKAAAQMAKIAVKHPARFAPYAAIPFLLAALIKHAYDVNDDDLKKLRAALPQWMKQRGHMLLLPYKDSMGRWQVVDMGYLAPWGQFADMAAQAREGGGAGAIAGSMVFSGPMMDVASAVQTNVDPFTNKPIVDPRDPPADRLQAMMQYVWNLSAPGWLTEQGALNQLRKSLSGSNLNKKTGEPGMTPTQASLRLLGLNIYPADPSATRAANLRAMKANLEQSRARAAELLRNKNLSDTERDRIRDVWAKLLEARAKEIEQYSRDSEINPKLE